MAAKEPKEEAVGNLERIGSPRYRQIRNLRYAAGMLCEGAWHFYSVLFDFIRFCTVRQIENARKCAL